MAFLVRLWQVDNHRHPIWRASIQDPHTGERLGFASLESLFAFLREQAGGDHSRAELGESTNISVQDT